MRLHLNVIQHDDAWLERNKGRFEPGGPEEQNTNATLFNGRRHNFHWNDDFSAFRPVPLLWWDDASYIRYQSGLDFDDPS